MLNLMELKILLISLVVCICLLIRQLCLRNFKQRLKNNRAKERCQQQEQLGGTHRVLNPLEQERLEQLVYSQWERGLGEQLGQWYDQPENRMPLEWKQTQQLRDQLERERKEWEQQQKWQREQFERELQQRELLDHSVDKAYIKAHWHHILGVASGAGPEEIKRAYHKCMSEYHPDKVSLMGEKIIAVAEIESQKINAAYEYAQSQGWV
jgi:hypothetical protein